MPKASKFLVQMLGADYHLLVASGSARAIRRFNTASLIMILIWILTFLSVFHAIDQLFRSWYMEWFMAAFVASLFILMYVFLVNTFTRGSFNTRKPLTISNVSRSGFVLFMAFVLSKPLEIWIYKAQYEAQVNVYRKNLVEEFNRHLNELYGTDEQKLAKRAAYLAQQADFSSTGAAYTELAAIHQSQQRIQRIKAMSLINARIRVEASPFFLQMVKCTAASFRGWLICLCIMVLFTLPGLIIFTIPQDDPYLATKAQTERRDIQAAFSKFHTNYLRIFSAQSLPVSSYATVWQDPPFNTLRKDNAGAGSQDDFLKQWGPFS